MAKKYSVENISDKPARPIMLMTGKAGMSLGHVPKTISTDGIPAILSEKEYGILEDVLNRYVEAGMVRVKVIEDSTLAPEKVEKSIKVGSPEEDEELKALRASAAELGIKGYQVMKKSTLEAAIVKASLAPSEEKTE